MEPRPHSSDTNKTYQLFLALILSIIVLISLGKVPVPPVGGNEESLLAQAAKTQKDSDACKQEKRRAIAEESGVRVRNPSTVIIAPRGERFTYPERGTEIDDCIAAVLKENPPIKGSDGVVDFEHPDNYRCVGRAARVIQRNRGGVSSFSVPNSKNPQGVCSVSYCAYGKGCAVAKSTPFNVQRLEQLLASPTTEDRRLEKTGELIRYPLRSGEYPNFDLDEGLGLTRDKAIDNDDYEAFKRLQDLWYDIREPRDLSSLPESRTFVSLPESLQNTRQLGFPGLQSGGASGRASAYERITFIGSNSTGFGGVYTSPALNGVSGRQWRQIVFVSTLRRTF